MPLRCVLIITWTLGHFYFVIFSAVHQHQLILLLAAAMATALDSSHNLASERSSIESTYELTKYLEYQLKEIKDIYVSQDTVSN